MGRGEVEIGHTKSNRRVGKKSVRDTPSATIKEAPVLRRGTAGRGEGQLLKKCVWRGVGQTKKKKIGVKTGGSW